jgi:KDO2-lipid IV(A) lauroyltransferase
VQSNLENSFPEKSPEEIEQISKSFYRYFCDLFLETFKTLTVSRSVMLRHCDISQEAQSLFDRLEAEKKSFVIVMGHKGNWEWAGNTFSLCCKHQLYVIYHPLSNNHFNKLVVDMRSRFGTKLIEMKNTFRDMVKNKSELNATAFIADQSPPPETAFWMTFLHQDTAIFKGTEKIVRKLDRPVVYVSVKRLKRGYYLMDAELLPVPEGAAPGEITAIHTKRLEKDIIEQPETWLWTHRRWKHKKENYIVTAF